MFKSFILSSFPTLICLLIDNDWNAFGMDLSIIWILSKHICFSLYATLQNTQHHFIWLLYNIPLKVYTVDRTLDCFPFIDRTLSYFQATYMKNSNSKDFLYLSPSAHLHASYYTMELLGSWNILMFNVKRTILQGVAWICTLINNVAEFL